MTEYEPDLSITLFEAGTLAVQLATFIVLFLTLRAVASYTRETKLLAAAAVEQIPRPVINVVQLPDVSEDAALEEMVSSILGTPTLRFKNVGTGHAVNFRYRIKNTGSTGPVLLDAPEGPTLAPGEEFDSNYPRMNLTVPSAFVAEYQSLGGAKYRSRANIEDRRWVRNFRFEKVED